MTVNVFVHVIIANLLTGTMSILHNENVMFIAAVLGIKYLDVFIFNGYKKNIIKRTAFSTTAIECPVCSTINRPSVIIWNS